MPERGVMFGNLRNPERMPVSIDDISGSLWVYIKDTHTFGISVVNHDRIQNEIHENADPKQRRVWRGYRYHLAGRSEKDATRKEDNGVFQKKRLGFKKLRRISCFRINIRRISVDIDFESNMDAETQSRGL
jgi:hypothetical protein